MKKLLVYLVSLLLIILQLTITPHFKFFKLNYGLVFSAVIVVSCIFDTKISIVNSLVCGVLFDCFASINQGTYLLLFFLTSVITVFISNFMYKGSLTTTVVLSFILTILSEIILYYIFVVSRGLSYHSFALTRIIVPQAFINAFITIIVFGIYKSLYKKLKLYTQW